MQITCDGKDYSLYQPNQFSLVFDKIPETIFWCQGVVVPSLTLGTAISENPYAQIKHPGEKLIFGPLEVSVLLDKEWKTYKELSNWMGDISTTKFNHGTTSQAQLILGDVVYYFDDLFPTSLSPISLNINVTDASPIVFEVSFDFTSFDIK
jgi:hypothetical protein